MRYLGILIWSFAISATIGYVLLSMAGEAFKLTPVLASTVIFTVIVTIVGDGIITKHDTNETVE
ncbi:hypothetical protein BN1058_01282 [Paraliobacillus sp. PM-2]|uniref:DUF2929 family protein n=1 Tax=Paraliobacillus sp. PM-2 TaxID=1462524 RepID=UPI00061CA883|nr:DUF2929 family protein [Paraliobacillus sp. PM-2]CQR46993.1 hypothetical protein BN1058_01282 [Paraliobacillus sp. PM-2]